MTQLGSDQQTVFREEDESAPPGTAPEMAPHKTSSGMEEHVAGMLCYMFGLITGILFLVLEKENRFVRFHAFQSTFTVIALFIINMVLSAIPIIGWLISLLLAPVSVGLWIFLMYKAYKGARCKLPLVGNLAEKQAYPG